MWHSCAPFWIPNSIQLNPLLGETQKRTLFFYPNKAKYYSPKQKACSLYTQLLGLEEAIEKTPQSVYFRVRLEKENCSVKRQDQETNLP